MIIDPIVTKVWCVRAPDIPGPTRAGHGALVLTSTKDADNAIIQAPLCIMNPRVRDLYDWNAAEAHELQLVGVRKLVNGRIRLTLEA